MNELAGLVQSIKNDRERVAMSIEREALELARRYSSGTVSAATMAAMDHPFARRHSAPLLDPSVINVQTGEFLAAWKTRREGEKIILYNDSPHAEFLEHGTRVMWSRPIGARIESELPTITDRVLRTYLGE